MPRSTRSTPKPQDPQTHAPQHPKIPLSKSPPPAEALLQICSLICAPKSPAWFPWPGNWPLVRARGNPIREGDLYWSLIFPEPSRQFLGAKTWGQPVPHWKTPYMVLSEHPASCTPHGIFHLAPLRPRLPLPGPSAPTCCC